jgi:hypothetical protein
MANDITTNPRLWALDSTGAVKTAGNRVYVSKIEYYPAAIDDDIIISEYAADGTTTKNVIRLKANHGAAEPVREVYPHLFVLNGLAVSTIDGGIIYLSVEMVTPKITA